MIMSIMYMKYLCSGVGISSVSGERVFGLWALCVIELIIEGIYVLCK